MKKFLIISSIIAPTILCCSCNNTFEPNAPLRVRYVLNGIMRSDTSLQVVTVSKSYEPNDGYNPMTSTQDPAVIGARISLLYKDSIYTMRDTVIARIDTSRYKDSVHCYYIRNLQPQDGEYVDISALMPNGFLLQASTELPYPDPFNFFSINSDKSVPPADPNKHYVSVIWKALPNTVYSPRVYIEYYVKNSSVKKEWPVPLYYDTENGIKEPVYTHPSKSNGIYISMESITEALNEIPQGDYKKNYSIASFNLEITIYDAYLSTYYLSMQRELGAYTVLLDSPDYSDIQGGYGIFGSYSIINYRLRFSYVYLSSLGYYY